ncbi:MAG: SemiSWEET transporter [Terracidiphilus sp.]
MINARWITDSIGLLAGFCTTLCLLPQLHSIWRRKSARDVSLAMFLVFGFGVGLWLIYGIRIASPPVIVANGATLALIIAILALKLRYDGKQ